MGDEEVDDEVVRRLIDNEMAETDKVRVRYALVSSCPECKRLHRLLDRERREHNAARGKHDKLRKLYEQGNLAQPPVILRSLLALPT